MYDGLTRGSIYLGVDYLCKMLLSDQLIVKQPDLFVATLHQKSLVGTKLLWRVT
jgi:hypothetical protein